MNRLNGKNEEDRRIYERSARLLLLLALRDIAPGAKARFDHSIGRGIYLNVSGVSLTASLVRRIEARMHELSRANLPIVQSRWTREQAVEYFRAQGQEDTVRLLTYRPFDYFDVYTCDGLSEYFYGGMVESTGEIESFALRFYYPGMVLLLPDEDLSGPPAPFVERPKLMRAYVEANVCSKILQCENAADLNDIIAKGEAQHVYPRQRSDAGARRRADCRAHCRQRRAGRVRRRAKLQRQDDVRQPPERAAARQRQAPAGDFAG